MVKRVRSRGRLQTLAVLTLALWQVRRTWFLLLVILLGMIAAVVIICTVPLLSTVLTTAGLRSTLRATPDSGDILLNTQTTGISSTIVQNVHEQFGSILQQNVGQYLVPTESALLCNDFGFYRNSQAAKSVQLVVYGTPLSQEVPYLGPIQGRVARTVPGHADQIEVMMTPDTAQQLGLHVGSSFKLALNYSVIVPDAGEQQHTAVVTVDLVGLFSVTPANTAYWHGENFAPLKVAVEGGPTYTSDTMVVSDQALLSLFDSLSAANHTNTISTDNYNGYSLIWHYQLNSSHLSSTDLDSLISKLANVQSTMSTQYGYLEQGNANDAPPTSLYLTEAQITSPVLDVNSSSTLEQFQDRIAVARIPSGVFTILISVLVLFFVSLMTTLLVDRQTEMIALLRSRGASRGQIFGSLLLQAIVVGLLALLIGLLLTYFAVFFLGQHLLPVSAQDALNIVTNHPVQALMQVLVYGLAIVLVTLLTMGFSLFVVARMDVLALRRETTRSTARPFWQRFYLDIVAGVVALAGYGFLLYVTSIGNELQGNAQVLVTTPLSIIAPFFLITGLLFLFLRIFPLLLCLGARLAARGRGAVALLALAQIARTPRQSLRMTLLLALATTFVLFTLFYTATQNQHIQDIVNYQTGADFSLHLNGLNEPPTTVTAQYRALPGVFTASAGYEDQGDAGTAELPVEIRAVDASTFDHAAFWPSPQTFQQADPLFKKLVALRPPASEGDVVPVIVDQTFVDKLQLHVGATFIAHTQNTAPNDIHCYLIGVVDHIPTIAPFLSTNDKPPVTTGGILMDYQTYLYAYQQDAQAQKIPEAQRNAPEVNMVWLHTTDNPTTLAGIRSTLNDSTFRFLQLTDRRLLLSTLQADPLYLIMDGVLTIGTLTALLLALVGGLLVSWISARSRIINVVTLRALGGTSKQVTGMFSWEQAIISLTGFVLGVVFGLLLAVSVIPSLTFTDLNSNLSNAQFFALQSALSTYLVVPPSLPLLLLIGAALYIAVVVLMVRSVARASLAQTLRLNED
jgi:ABC-type antimicrobial peptide transport system permease subunit